MHRAQALRTRYLTGTAQVRRIGLWSFPVYELVQGNAVLARMGRFGWLSIFLGSGQRIELANGSNWRIASVGFRGTIRPRVVNAQGQRVAVSSLAAKHYGINGKDYGYMLYPADSHWFGQSNAWVIGDRDTELARVLPHPLSIEAVEPVPLSAVFLSLVLVRYGIPGELSPRVPALRWG